MSPKRRDAGRPSRPPGRSGAILDFLEQFNRESGVDDPLVKVTLVTGETFYFYGLRIDPSPVVTGTVMLRWLVVPSVLALVVDEGQIARVEFEIIPPEPVRPPLGFRVVP